MMEKEPSGGAGAPATTRLDRKDLRFFAVLWGISLLFMAGVFGAATILTPKTHVFLGSIHDSATALSYQAWTNAFAHEGRLADNPSALVRRAPAYFNLVWFLMGRIQAAGVPFLTAYYLFRVLVAGMMLLAILLFMRRLILDRTMAWAATLVASFGTGFGWLYALIDPSFEGSDLLTADLLLGDSFPVNTIWTFPHLALAHVLVLLIYYFMCRAVAERGHRPAAAAAGIVMVTGFTHPYHFVTVLPVLAAWFCLLQVKHGRTFAARWIDLGIVAAAMLPGALYYRWLTQAAPNFSRWGKLNAAPTGGFLQVIVGYGLIALLAVIGYRHFLPARRYTDGALLVAVWPPVQFAIHMSYPRLFFAGKLGIGLIYPLAVLAVWGLFWTVVPLFRRAQDDPRPETDIREGAAVPVAAAPSAGRLRWAVALVVLCLPTTGFHLWNSFREHLGYPSFVNLSRNSWTMVSRLEVEALRFLAAQSREFPLVLSGPRVGLLLPAFAPVRSYMGQITQIPDYMYRRSRFREFYKSTHPEFSRELLAQEDIDYVWWGFEEDALGYPRSPDRPFLTRLFDNGLVSIYRVERAAL